MKKTPTISVIIPVYNVEDYLTKCVQSVLHQTYTQLEILLVDDGSTDSSGKLCDQLQQTDSRIQVFHTPNGGLSAARNVGLDHATGEYIGFVDSDDWIEPDMYMFLYEQLTQHDADISICSHYFDKGSDSRCKRQLDYPIVCDRDKALDMLMTDKIIHNYAWDKLYKRSLFDGLRYPVGVLYEDIAFTYKTFFRSNRIVVFAQPKYHYIVRPGSIVSGRYTIKRNISYFNAEYAFMSDMYEHGYTDSARHLVRRGIHSIKRLILSGASDDIIHDLLTKLAPYHFVGIKQIGLANVQRRWWMEHHLTAYKKAYILSKKLLGKYPK